MVDVLRDTVGEGGIAPMVEWAREVLASAAARDVLAELERRGAAVGRLLFASLLHRTGPALFDCELAVRSFDGSLVAPAEIRGIDAVLTGDRARRDGDPPLEVLQRVREDLEDRRRATDGQAQEFHYVDGSGGTHMGMTEGGASVAFPLGPPVSDSPGHAGPPPKGPGRGTDNRKAVMAVLVAGHVAHVDRAVVFDLAPRFLVHVARYRSSDELTTNPVRTERERCRRQFQRRRDPWVLRRAKMIAGELGLPVDLDP
jgi:hypothetical protein